MKKIAVSVIVPIYNGAKYVEHCCKQLSNQTLKGMEFILVNDGSTDKTAEICDQMERQYLNCRVIHQLNRGVSFARNSGLQIASGEYVGFVDVDDEFEIDMFEMLYETAMANNLEIISMENNGKSGEVRVYKGRKEAIKDFLDGKISIAVWNKLFHRSLRPELSFPVGKKIYEDCMAVYWAICKANQIGTINIQKYHYIRREKSSSRSVVFSPKYFDAITIINTICGEVEQSYPLLQDVCMKRKANTYLRISKIYYLRKHPKEFKAQIKELKTWLKTIPRSKLNYYYNKKNHIRYLLYIYCFPAFLLLIKTIDRR